MTTDRRSQAPPRNARARRPRYGAPRSCAHGAGHIGAVAFSRSGDPMTGEFGDAKLLRKFGNVPEDLATL